MLVLNSPVVVVVVHLARRPLTADPGHQTVHSQPSHFPAEASIGEKGLLVHFWEMLGTGGQRL